jgi:hypothetical protein
MAPLIAHNGRLTDGSAKTATFSVVLGNKPIKALWLSLNISAISGAGATITPQITHSWDVGAPSAFEVAGTGRTTTGAFSERFSGLGPDAKVRFLIAGTTPSITFTCTFAVLYEDAEYAQGELQA